MMDEKITEMKICKDCGIVVTDSRTGSTALFIIGDLEPFYKGTVPQLKGSDGGGLGYRICVEYHEEETETREKAEKLEAIKTWYNNLDVDLEGSKISFSLFEFSNLKKILEGSEAPSCPRCGKRMVLKFCDKGSPPNRFVCDCEEAS